MRQRAGRKAALSLTIMLMCIGTVLDTLPLRG
jgi:hypothetical protein